MQWSWYMLCKTVTICFLLHIQTGPNHLNHYYRWPAVVVIQMVWPGLYMYKWRFHALLIFLIISFLTFSIAFVNLLYLKTDWQSLIQFYFVNDMTLLLNILAIRNKEHERFWGMNETKVACSSRVATNSCSHTKT